MLFRGRALSRRMSRQTVVATVIGLSLALSASSVQAVAPNDDDRGRTSGPAVQDDGDPAKGFAAKAKPRPADPARKAAVKGLDKAVWPKQGGAEVRLGASTEAGGLPVKVVKPKSVQAPGKVRVDVLDPKRSAKLGAGVLLGVERADGAGKAGKVRLTVDYSEFAEGYGGCTLPGCAWSSCPPAPPSPPPAVRTARSSPRCCPR